MHDENPSTGSSYASAEQAFAAFLREREGEFEGFCRKQAAYAPMLRVLFSLQVEGGEGRKTLEFVGSTPASRGPGFPSASLAALLGSEERPDAVGPYRILRVLGEGGMGTVYLAEQTEPIRRRVALKLMRPGLGTRETIARFEAERQMLAFLDHPNITTIHDAGTTERGRPYFVMEYVDGEPITDFCDRHRLSIRERLELFAQVSGAVEHANARGVIHRDLKPSNVLVTFGDSGPLVKVIDFGIARAQRAEIAQRTLYTHVGQIVGTPAYMSPEQTRGTGEQVDRRSDVYALGLILYDLLAGDLPFDSETLAKLSLDELFQRIREEDAPLPSVRYSRFSAERRAEIARRRSTDSSALSRQLRGDLDWIALRAIEKEPSRRYASALDFTEDIERHLGNQPVAARPPSGAYLLRKYVRRNRTAVAAAAAVFVALTVGLIVSIAFALEARQESMLARAASREADESFDLSLDAVVTFFQHVSSDSLLGVPGLTGLRRDLLEMGAEFFEAILAKRANDPKARLDDGAIRTHLGEILLLMGEGHRAFGVLREAIQILETLEAEDPGRAEVLFALATAWLHLGGLHYTLERWEEAKDEFTESLAVLDRAEKAGSVTVKTRTARGNALNNIGSAHERLEESRDAEARYCEALEIRSALMKEHRDSFALAWPVSQSHYNRGNFLQYRMRYQEAATEYRAALELQREWVEHPQAGPDHRHDLASTLAGLGNAYQSLATLDVQVALQAERPGDFRAARAAAGLDGYDAAERCFADAIKLLRPLQHEFREIPKYTESLAGWLYNQGNLLYWRYQAYLQLPGAFPAPLEDGYVGRIAASYAEAIELLREAEPRLQGGRDFDEPLARYQLGAGNVYQALGKREPARAAFEDAIERFHRVLRRSHPPAKHRELLGGLAGTQFNLGSLFYSLFDDLEGAWKAIEQAARIGEERRLVFEGAGALSAAEREEIERSLHTYRNGAIIVARHLAVREATRADASPSDAERSQVHHTRRAVDIARRALLDAQAWHLTAQEPWCSLYLGICLYRDGRSPEAGRWLRQALEAEDPGEEMAFDWLRIALALAAQGDRGMLEEAARLVARRIQGCEPELDGEERALLLEAEDVLEEAGADEVDALAGSDPSLVDIDGAAPMASDESSTPGGSSPR